MEKLAAIWDLPLWAALGALIVIALVVAWMVRLRAGRDEGRLPAPAPPAEGDPDAVDSSHIGFAPLVSDPPQRATPDAERHSRGEDPLR